MRAKFEGSYHLLYTVNVLHLFFRVVEEVMDLTFSLLELSYNNELHVHPLHYFCLLDPQALWFQKWMVIVMLCIYLL